MKRVELLAPAGNMEALIAAVQNGADAVYLAGKSYGARAFAGNFSDEEIVEAIRYCHHYQVKVYVTMNTLLFPEEIESAFEYALFLHTHKVDALIIQDFGLLELLHTRLPNLELHASTQMHSHNINSIKLLKDVGISRVVVARETPIALIKEMCKLGIEIEMFVFGALCVSYSGQCYMSINQGNRSGNRGGCAQPCRMQYRLVKDDEVIDYSNEYLLSPKDLNTLEHIDELVELGVSSFKIEGRMKRPEYVALIASEYRKAIDQKGYQPDIIGLKKIFNRGFTDGHLYHKRGDDLMSTHRPNHMGIPLGTVVAYRNKQVFIKLSHPLHQQDGIRILDKKDFGFVANRIYKDGKLVNGASVNDIIALDSDNYINKGAQVVLTSDVMQLKQLRTTFETRQRYQPIQAIVTGIIGQPLHLTLLHPDAEVSCCSDEIIQQAQRQPITTDKIAQQLSKTQDTPFVLDDIQYYVDDDMFISLKTINQLRRDAIEMLINELDKTIEPVVLPYTSLPIALENHRCIRMHVHTEEQYDVLKDMNYPIYTDNVDLLKKYPTLGYVSLRVNESNAMYDCNSLYARELGALYENHSDKHGDLYFNVTNAYALYFLYKHQCVSSCLSPELSMYQIQDLIEQYRTIYQQEPVIEQILYGRQDVMVSKYCMVNTLETTHQKKHCNLCKKHTYQLQGNQNYPLLFDEECFMHILQANPVDVIEDINSYEAMGIQQFSIRFTNESKLEVLKKVSFFN